MVCEIAYGFKFNEDDNEALFAMHVCVSGSQVKISYSIINYRNRNMYVGLET